MNLLFGLALSPTALLGLVGLAVLAQIFAAIRKGEAGVWQARRWGMWMICLYCGATLLLMDVANLVWGMSASALLDSPIHRGIAGALLGYIGGCLIALTVTGGLIAGVTRLISGPSPSTGDPVARFSEGSP